jgi:tRNA(Ile)-lysidine synthase
MKISLPAGKYVVAVSGGVDSMVLLDLLSSQPGLELVVAHFNHGIRPDASKDERLVKTTVAGYGLPLETGYGHLGPQASEAAARRARYQFLNQIRSQHQAKAVITAHHQDDLIETALINTLRGTNWAGLVALSSSGQLLRPLLDYSKQQLADYAKKNSLKWREDASNLDKRYLRNYLRQSVIPKMTQADRRKLLKNIDSIAKNKNLIKDLIATLSHNILTDMHIDRGRFNQLPVNVAAELMVSWLNQLKAKEVDKKSVNRLVVAVKTAKAGSVHDIDGRWQLTVSRQTARFTLKL